jgi:GntR family transcriptional repressor for pyruvate dehydrogenase complex
LPSERDLAQRFGVHRSTIREAFKRLEQLGVAEIRPGGARVAPIEEASLDVVEHLLALEDPPELGILEHAREAISGFLAMAARLGTERADAEQRAGMLEILTRLRHPEIPEDEREDCVRELGDRFVEASGNMVLAMVHRSLRSKRDDFARKPGVPGHVNPAPYERVAPHLERLAQAIEDADGATAADSIYNISRVIREAARERSLEANRPKMAAVAGERV